MNKAYNRTYWQNKPSTETPIDADNLNNIEAGIDTIDDRVVALDTSQSELTTRVTTAEGNITSLQNDKVDKVSGKGLSTNDYTDTDKTKLAGISAQANRTTVTQVQESGDTSKEIAQIGLDGETTSIYADDAKKVIESCYEEKTVTGNPITVKTISGSNAKSLTVSMNPIQDLHGYDYPWVGGAGKNKLQNTATTDTINGVTFTVNTDGSVTTNNTATNYTEFIVNSNFSLPSGTYILNGAPTNSGNARRILLRKVGESTAIATDVGSGAEFTLSETTSLNLAITISNGQALSNYAFKPMIRLSTVTDATFAPYSNICPISGWTEVSVYQDTEQTETPETTHTHQYSETIYGGVDDFVNGGLINDKELILIDGQNKNVSFSQAFPGYNRFIASYNSGKNPNYKGSSSFCMCDKMMPNFSPIGGERYAYSVWPHSSGVMLLFPSGDITNEAEANAWLQANPVTVCYELATPPTVETSAEEIELLKGQNVLSTDADDMELSYQEIPDITLLVQYVQTLEARIKALEEG